MTTMSADLSDISFWAEPIERRHAGFAELRDRPGLPFYTEPKVAMFPPGRGFYALTRMDDVLTASRTPALYTSGQGGTVVTDMPPELLEFTGSMINMDDPRHGRLRRIVSRGFTPKMLDALTENVSRVATEIVDEVIARGECDAVADIAAKLPLTIICDMMGIPDSQRRLVFDRTNLLLGAQDPEYVPNLDGLYLAAFNAANDLTNLMRELAERRRGQDGTDLTSVLLNARVDGEALTPDELASFFILLVAAGNETTRNAISWGIQLLMFYWAANRDPKYFEAPERFDIRRSPNRHIGFGGPGPHFCLGAHLARREITVMFRELLTRIPDIHATAEPDRLKSAFINGIKRLPVTFSH